MYVVLISLFLFFLTLTKFEHTPSFALPVQAKGTAYVKLYLKFTHQFTAGSKGHVFYEHPTPGCSREIYNRKKSTYMGLILAIYSLEQQYVATSYWKK